MVFQIDTLNVPNTVNDFLQNEGTIWNVLPGVGMLEKEINSLEDLYAFIERCELASNVPLSFNLQPLSSKVEEARGVIHIGDKEKDEEPMIYLTITKV